MGQPLHRPQPLCWEHEGNRAVRAGDLKLVSKLGLPWELYDLAADRTEQRDLAAERPAAVAPLVALYEAWAARAFVEPWRGGPRDNAGRVIGSEDDDGKSATAPAAKAKGKKKGKSL
jgi:arylsulfatase